MIIDTYYDRRHILSRHNEATQRSDTTHTIATHTIATQRHFWECSPTYYGLATVSRIDKIIGLFCRISSLLQGSFAKETYNLIDPTNQSHPISRHNEALHSVSCCIPKNKTQSQKVRDENKSKHNCIRILQGP